MLSSEEEQLATVVGNLGGEITSLLFLRNAIPIPELKERADIRIREKLKEVKQAVERAKLEAVA
jgi:hypothetical protein